LEHELARWRAAPTANARNAGLACADAVEGSWRGLMPASWTPTGELVELTTPDTNTSLSVVTTSSLKSSPGR
jgi:hypothetical protein